MDLATLSSALPFGVSVYSTRGGFSRNAVRLTMPSSSRTESLRVSVRVLISESDASSSPKRFGPVSRSRTISNTQKSPTRSEVFASGQVEQSFLRWSFVFGMAGGLFGPYGNDIHSLAYLWLLYK